MEFRVGHLAYGTTDMKKTLVFYTEMLGFQHVFSLKDDQGQPWIEYVMMPDGRFLEFFYASPNEAMNDHGYRHLCLEVDDCADAVHELEEKGVAIAKPILRGKDGNLQAWIHDPDGRDIEIMQIHEGSEQHLARQTLQK